MTGPRDWDKEMAEIDRLIAAGKAPPPAGSPAPVARRDAPAPHVVASGAAPVVTRRRHTIGVWLRAILGVAGAVALPFWPYARSCGPFLGLYLLGAVGVAAAGVWTMRGSWTHRRGVAHSIGVLILLAGVALIAIEVLERSGFAAVHRTWICP
ncbi:MAG TPA: hypothetical protein VGL65_05440 [Gemmatimonadales bacterium]|jgi:hypothetical protein